MNIPKLVKQTRQDMGLSQKEFGEMFGISHASVSDWERGKFEPRCAVMVLIFDNLLFKENTVEADKLREKLGTMTINQFEKAPAYRKGKEDGVRGFVEWSYNNIKGTNIKGRDVEQYLQELNSE